METYLPIQKWKTRERKVQVEGNLHPHHSQHPRWRKVGKLSAPHSLKGTKGPNHQNNQQKQIMLDYTPPRQSPKEDKNQLRGRRIPHKTTREGATQLARRSIPGTFCTGIKRRLLSLLLVTMPLLLVYVLPFRRTRARPTKRTATPKLHRMTGKENHNDQQVRRGEVVPTATGRAGLVINWPLEQCWRMFISRSRTRKDADGTCY